MNSAHYSDLRRSAAKEVESTPAFQGLDFSIREIDHEALVAHADWGQKGKQDRLVEWDWTDLIRRYRRTYSSRLDMAIWHEDTLCGLALGKVSDGKLVVRVCYVEGSPDATPLSGKVFAVVDLYLETYAISLGIETIALQDPFQELIPHYEDYGYVKGDPFDPRNSAMIRVIAPD